MSADSLGEENLSARHATMREFVVAWRDPDETMIPIVGSLSFDAGWYEFRYDANVRSIAGFRPLVEFPDLDASYRSKELFPFFSQRVMDPGRPDYSLYINALNLKPNASQLDVLSRSGGKRKADKIQLVEVPRADAHGFVGIDFLAHGLRFSRVGEAAVSEALSALTPGDELRLVREPDNPVNPRALLIANGVDTPLGWVPDPLLPYVTPMLDDGRSRLTVLRVNPPEFAWQLRLVVRLEGYLVD